MIPPWLQRGGYVEAWRHDRHEWVKAQVLAVVSGEGVQDGVEVHAAIDQRAADLAWPSWFVRLEHVRPFVTLDEYNAIDPVPGYARDLEARRIGLHPSKRTTCSICNDHQPQVGPLATTYTGAVCLACARSATDLLMATNVRPLFVSVPDDKRAAMLEELRFQYHNAIERPMSRCATCLGRRVLFDSTLGIHVTCDVCSKGVRRAADIAAEAWVRFGVEFD